VTVLLVADVGPEIIQDRFHELRFEGGKNVVAMIFDYIIFEGGSVIFDRAPSRRPLGRASM
jgi:hypothetical protein